MADKCICGKVITHDDVCPVPSGMVCPGPGVKITPEFLSTRYNPVYMQEAERQEEAADIPRPAGYRE